MTVNFKSVKLLWNKVVSEELVKLKREKKVDVWRVSYYFVQKVSLSYLK